LLGVQTVDPPQVQRPLPRPHPRPVDEDVPEHEVHRLRAEAPHQQVEDLLHPLGVGLVPLVLRVHDRARVDHLALGDERKHGHPRLLLPVAGGERHHPACPRWLHLGTDVDPEALEQPRQGPELLRVVVVPRDHDARDPLGGEPGQEVVDEPLGLGWRRRRVEDVSGHEYRVDLAVDGDPRHLVERGRVLVHAGAPAERLADVPVGGVEKAHVRRG
jgi:hypothetical protein